MGFDRNFPCCTSAGSRLVQFPNASLTHAWLGLYSTAPVGSIRGLVEWIIWKWFGVTYNRLAEFPLNHSNTVLARLAAA